MAASNISLLDELERSIRKKIFSPLYYFYGDEDFLLQETVDAIVAYALDASEKSFNFDVVNGYDADAKEIVQLSYLFSRFDSSGDLSGSFN